MIPDTVFLERYPFLADLRFSVGGVADTPPPVLALLLAAAEKRAPGACCFVLPRATSITMSLGILGALTRIKAEFPGRVEEYARRQFVMGQRVRVLPTGHIYEFDGVFEAGRESTG